MNTLENIKICVVGLGYVGLPLACLFAKKYPTVGYDRNMARVEALLSGTDATREVDDCRLGNALSDGLRLVANLRDALRNGVSVNDIKDGSRDVDSMRTVFIVAVPTPVDDDNRPDLRPLLSASDDVGSVLRKGDVVVYESTVYPGMTEDECVPALCRASGLRYNVDFFVGYSPERVNPGDRVHSVETICKVTSGSTPETADLVDALYSSVVTGGTYRASSIRVAEASKIVENCQRDVNIAFVNELAKIFNAMGIDTADVLNAAATKWNFITMRPGLVGGHCIGVDPYYMIEKAQVYGVLPRVMDNARRLNDGMGVYVAQQTVHCMNVAGVNVKNCRVLILGFAFKENCPDTRNTKVADIYNTFAEYTDNITVVDPWVDSRQVERDYGISVLNSLPVAGDAVFDAAILAVAHSQFVGIDIRSLVPLPGVVYDVKGLLDRDSVTARL